jgi:hypothetical protein
MYSLRNVSVSYVRFDDSRLLCLKDAVIHPFNEVYVVVFFFFLYLWPCFLRLRKWTALLIVHLIFRVCVMTIFRFPWRNVMWFPRVCP